LLALSRVQEAFAVAVVVAVVVSVVVVVCCCSDMFEFGDDFVTVSDEKWKPSFTILPEYLPGSGVPTDGIPSRTFSA
jgi:hypothetical protein